ncbi:HNH endonuclease signature motif containing protein [Helicobacter pylori]|uniref:HNH endonuclease signature motif containing protein n=1 Tax=Helicobacter pylori TaxID=210 RepID=UPI0002BAEB2C|nr:HNH endonuclease signature motif containing protein [Helicobacter pylori]MDO7808309.1 HNH endonuclease signature motif containing protein [Helicobacter pylori]MDO7814345.1 HNH endonuclease signature motif containing protein [Helicobacter pylori]MDO7819269.1 HNH endonuclease signature motif containing protein [Helicobacter pylori]MDO7827828.1 HNH endonuclease signature motif containing protein [Helicobacter pylori]MDO7865402.1 HNH endonuclease signature motif containing protein [Helicobacter
MLVSHFLNDNIDPFNLGVLLSRFQIKNGCIYGVCSYKSSKFVHGYEESKVQVLNALNTLSVHPIWQSNQESVTKIKGTFVFILENDLHLDENAFYKKLLNSLIDNDFFNRSYSMTPNQRLFLSGFFESRGSIDTQRNFLTLDYFFHSPLEFNKFHYLIDFFNIPSEALNFNFRELQHEHVQGINQRNAQFRIYLDWYLYHIGLFNPYKVRIAHHVFKTTLIYDGIYYKLSYPPTTKYHGNGFTERAHFYLKNVYQQDLDKKRIKELRERLGLIQNSEEFKRDSKIINFYRISTPNVCSACCGDYDIKERSFISLPLYKITQRSDSYYTEIHHVISLGKDKELDVLENLAKLCPTCHRALRKGASEEGFQKRLIRKILKRNKGNLEFAQLRFETDDFLTLIDRIYESLK